MEHGGDLLSYERYYKGQLIDYSSNINPLGLPKGIEKVLMDSFNEINKYPDIKYRKLKTSISKYLKCNAENIIVGNGAVELIDNFVMLADRVFVCTPSFSEYEKRAVVHKKEVIKISYDTDFIINIKFIESTIKKEDLLILGNPNNPTGLRVGKSMVQKLYNVIRKSEACLVLDEAFFEFCPEDYDSIELFKPYNYENLGVIRAATKFFALPGIRLGYGCTSVYLAKKISNIELPWSINSFAQAAGNFIFKDKEYIKKSKEYMKNERQYIYGELLKLTNIKVFPTETNYILIKLLKWDEEYVFKFFLERGILIRKCSGFSGLDNRYIRIAIKERHNNKKIIEIFNELEGHR